MINKINQFEDVRQLQLRRASATAECGSNFGQLLRSRVEANDGLRFSKHAAERVSQRGIEMSETFLGKLEAAVEEARSKGAKDVVIISDKGAFIVNVPNNTVVTTTSGHIFTNIDSAVVL